MKKKLFHKSKFIKFEKQAFTLAEILVTLSIIGVVAAMTIPTLMQKQEEKKTVSALKKAYSTLSNAYTLAVQENGTPEHWNLIGESSIEGAENLANTILPYLKVIKNCGTASGCSPGAYKSVNGSTDWYMGNNFAKSILNDGSTIYFLAHSANCSSSFGNTIALKNTCGSFMIDINGFKPPNRLGEDSFHFWITKYGIVPIGTQQESRFLFPNDCNVKTTGHNRSGCAAWVVYNENMDYMHCDDLSWDGKKKCN